MAESYICNPGDVLYIPKDNHIAYECDEKCVIFYAAYPHDWKATSRDYICSWN
jgi:ethanolamine utilization protein EutQ